MKSSLNKILIIGGEGYIGSFVVNYFLEKGLKVDSFDNLPRCEYAAKARKTFFSTDYSKQFVCLQEPIQSKHK